MSGSKSHPSSTLPNETGLPTATEHALVEQAGGGALLVDAEGALIDVNQRALAMLGFSREEVLRLRFTDLLPPEDQAEVPACFNRHATGARARRYWNLKRKGGALIVSELGTRALPQGHYLVTLRDVREVLRAEHLRAGEINVLEMIARGDPLPQILEALTRAIEAEAGGLLCSILLLDEERRQLRHGAAPSLPPAYNEAIDGVEIGPSVGSCGTAAFTGETVIAADLQTDPHWENYRDLAAQHHLRACWSTPIKSSKNRVLGTFALYYHEPREPGAMERQLIEHACHLAGIAIERQHELEALRQSRRRYKDLVTSLDSIVWEADAQTFQFRFVSPQAERLLGYPLALWFQPGFWPEHLHPEDREQAVAYCATSTRENRSHEFEYRMVTADGRVVWLHDIVTVISEGDKPVLLRGVMVDITPRKQAEAEIRQLNERLEERVRQRTAQLEAANQELEAFSYSVSHDLRAPLRHITGFAEMLATRAGPGAEAESRELVDNILTASRTMTQLIDDLLLFCRTSREAMSVQQFPLEPLVAEVREGLQNEVGDRDVSWRTEPLPEVRADPALLRQVLVNLLGNAIKYTRPRPRAVIEIKADQTDHETVISIKDNGVGFDQACANKLFGVFQRLHSENEFEGTGIGLANVRRIIARHGGRTWAEGVPEAGATFYFSLPRAAMTDQPPNTAHATDAGPRGPTQDTAGAETG